MPRKIIIIGAGLGGLALAARLAHQGNEVHLFEKNAAPGGRVTQRKVRGYTIDLGPSFLLMPGEFEELFAYCREPLPKDWELLPQHPLYRLHFANQSFLDIDSDIPTMQKNFHTYDAENAAQNFQSFLDFLAYEQEKYSIVYEKFITRPTKKITSLIFSRDIVSLFQLDGFHSMWENMHPFFDDENLKLAFSFQSMYIGESPLLTPGTYSIIPFIELTQGAWYPKKGMYSIIQHIEKLAKKKGVVFHYQQKVKEILIHERKTKGIELENGKIIHADVVISNLDLPATYHSLIPKEKRKKYTDEKLSKLRYGCSAFILCIGTTAHYEQLTHHNFFFSEDYKKNIDEIFQTHTIPMDPSFYVNVSTKTNPSIAPKGKNLFYVLVLVPRSAEKDGKKVDWPAYKKEYAQHVITLLEKKGLNGLSKKINMLEILTPDDWENMVGMHLGSTFGLSPIFSQSTIFRPNQKSEEFQNLYFVGASTHPGGGMPFVLISARTCEKHMQDDFASKQEKTTE
ncbi:MAG: phytoene desaturase family protein [Candidatus Diapherotrites archaeon]